MSYENWFLIHSGLKKPEVHAPNKGGFLLKAASKLKEIEKIINAEKPKEEKGTTRYEEKETTRYERWFYRNCDNNNIPDLSDLIAHDYYIWFEKHCVKRAPEPKYASTYEAWFFNNCDNRNIPDVSKITSLEYSNWLEKHATKTVSGPIDKSYRADLERNCDSKNPGVMSKPFLTYPQWFDKHSENSIPVKSESYAIYIKTITGKTISIYCLNDETIQNIKNKITIKYYFLNKNNLKII